MIGLLHFFIVHIVASLYILSPAGAFAGVIDVDISVVPGALMPLLTSQDAEKHHGDFVQQVHNENKYDNQLPHAVRGSKFKGRGFHRVGFKKSGFLTLQSYSLLERGWFGKLISRFPRL